MLLFELPRALAWAAAVAIIVQLIAVLALRSVRRGSWVATLVLAIAIDVRLAVAAVWLIVAWVYVRRTGRRINVERPLLAFISVMFVISLTRALGSEAFRAAWDY